ncbi:MAG: aminotransferase class V-fold PLP-dependent enzyme [Helicobacteraceae bacterium]|nr:aminotransferase class V-fold PLP-dependent enzyme [Helicobacteraceae bacterium]
MSKLAINGGTPIRTKYFGPSITTGKEEVEAGTKVLESGLLSGFVGSPSDEFFGGKFVKQLEKDWSEKFNVKHSVSCNSATSALIMAMGAIEIGPGDEVIVSPYTMSATATAILFYNAIPIFADIEDDMFCLDPKSIEKRITPNTKAIITTDIHGQPSDMDAIMDIAKKYDLRVVVDAAQSPGAKYKDKYAGTVGDVGVYSLNRHKNIQTGEGGIAVTKDDELALRMQLIRNHAEALTGSGIERFTPKSLVNMLGFNFRMTEVEAAIGIEQLKKIDDLNAHRLELTEYLNEKLSKYEAIILPKVRPGCSHIYYMHIMKFDEDIAGISRERFIEAIRAEGITIWGGYMKPLYLEPLYQKKIAYKGGYPFKNNSAYDKVIDYSKGLCPVAERLYEKETIVNIYNYSPLTIEDMEDIVNGFEKVFSNISDLK